MSDPAAAPARSAAPEESTLLLRFGELTLKSEAVRRRFTQILRRNIEESFSRAGLDCLIRDDWGHLYVDTSDLNAGLAALSRTFGLTSVSPVAVLRTAALLEVAAYAADYAMRYLPAGAKTFAVRPRRTGSHPYSSTDVGRVCGAAIFQAAAAAGRPLAVDLDTPDGDRYTWPDSTYVRKPPYFDGMPAEPAPVSDIEGARVLLKLGDSITTDHISPAGSIKADSPAGQYLSEHGVERKDFNSYGSRRGNHEVMIRGTFANIRLRNQLAPDTEGGFTRDFTSADQSVTTVYEASQHYLAAGTPLVVLAGKEYGSGSSRDWAAKGTALLGVKAVIAESYERIHRSNLIGMGVLPLQFPEGQSASSLGLTGEETFDIIGVTELNAGRTPSTVKVTAGEVSFDAVVRIDTPGEADYYRNGGIMQYVLRSLIKN